MEEQILEAAAEGGLLNVENGIKVLAAIGALTIGYYGGKACRNAWRKRGERKAGNVRKDDSGREDYIDVEAKTVA